MRATVFFELDKIYCVCSFPTTEAVPCVGFWIELQAGGFVIVEGAADEVVAGGSASVVGGYGYDA